jgi:ABC-type antimicrobial peptide transport system permease subunit
MMVISEEIERRLWPSGNALGECLRLNKADAPCHTIIGVAENANGWTIIEKPNTVMYVTLRRPAEAWALVVRTSSDPTPVVERLRAELGDTIPGATDHAVELLAETLAPQYRPWQLGAKLFTGFATLAVVLAGLGLYSVLAYLVTLRHHEFGIRLALGATDSNVVRLVITDGVRHVAAGIIGGLVIVFFGSRFLVPLLYDVSPRDPVVLGAAVLVLLLGAIVAALFPARRAVRVDPLVALRSE